MVVCVIIPTHNRLRTLRNLLSDIQEQTIAHNIQLIPVVVIDGSIDGTIEYCKDKGVKHIVGDGDWWYTKCVNEGVKYSIEILNTDFILLTNDDVRMETNLIDSLIKVCIQVNELNTILTTVFKDVNSGKVIYLGSNKFSKYLLHSTIRKSFESDQNVGIPGVYLSHDLSGRCIFFHHNVWADLGQYDESLFQYGSDTEFGIRALMNAYRILIVSTLYVLVSVDDTCKSHLSKGISVKSYIYSLFNKYSSNYVYNRIRINEKHAYSSMRLVNNALHLSSVVYVFIKFKFKKQKKGL